MDVNNKGMELKAIAGGLKHTFIEYSIATPCKVKDDLQTGFSLKKLAT